MKMQWLKGFKRTNGKVPPAPRFDLDNIKVKDLKELYLSGEHKELARILPHARDIKNDFIESLLGSRLLTMGIDLKDLEPITLGADPEFILKAKDTGEIVLFSSEYIMESSGINMSEAVLGADYGLLEIRPTEATSAQGLVENIKDIFDVFNERFDNLAISEVEAAIFDHKKERIRSLIKNEKVDFGMNMRKINMGGIQDINIGDETTYLNKTLSAYDEPLMFPDRPDLLTAGGHIHIGGTFVRMLSLEQLKGLIKNIDESVYDQCSGVETAAGTLRREIYGNRGEFRIKPYGVEYRTPSNAIFWQKNVKTLKEVLEKIYTMTKTTLKTGGKL